MQNRPLQIPSPWEVYPHFLPGVIPGASQEKPSTLRAKANVHDCEDFAESESAHFAFAIAGISPPVGVAVPGCSSAAYPVHQHQTDASGGADMLGFN